MPPKIIGRLIIGSSPTSPFAAQRTKQVHAGAVISGSSLFFSLSFQQLCATKPGIRRKAAFGIIIDHLASNPLFNKSGLTKLGKKVVSPSTILPRLCKKRSPKQMMVDEAADRPQV